MSMQDTIADMLTRIRNAQKVRAARVSMPTSKVRVALAGVLEREGYIKGFDLKESASVAERTLTIELKYHQGKPVIALLQRISRPGLRRYVDHKSLPRVLDGLGIAVLSTSKGWMTEREAAAAHVGGELICYVA